MSSVTYECIQGVVSFHVTAPDGSDIVIHAGKPLTTEDPRLIAVLDGATHAVKRVKKEKES